jgi:hypothetical protein
MDIFATYHTSFLVLAALVIFVVGYLALFLSLMICVLLAHFTLEGFRVVRTHLVTSSACDRNPIPCEEIET